MIAKSTLRFFSGKSSSRSFQEKEKYLKKRKDAGSVFLTNSPAQTRNIGKALATEILSMRIAQPSPSAQGMRMRPCEFLGTQKKRAVVIGLIGDLGGGKTTFLQGLAKGLGIREKILSPTFVILKKFKIKNPRFRAFYHIDCYRIRKPKELLSLGFGEILNNSENIIAAEWADRTLDMLPKNAIILKFDHIDANKRRIECSLKR